VAELGGPRYWSARVSPWSFLDFGLGSPVFRLFPDPGTRRALTGFLFGMTGALIAVPPLGRLSGAHINLAVSFSFWLAGKMRAW
jgi:aquaporin Z